MDPKSFNIGANFLGEFIEDASSPGFDKTVNFPKSFNVGAKLLGEFIEDASIPNFSPEVQTDNRNSKSPGSSTSGTSLGGADGSNSREPETGDSKDNE